MGYDIHITRRNSWSDKGEPAITRQEWQAILADDSDLDRLDDDDAQMLDPSRRAGRRFYYADGSVFVRKPNKPVLMKMLAIAEKLGARVVGDDDEVYSRDGLPSKRAQFTITEDW